MTLLRGVSHFVPQIAPSPAACARTLMPEFESRPQLLWSPLSGHCGVLKGRRHLGELRGASEDTREQWGVLNFLPPRTPSLMDEPRARP